MVNRVSIDRIKKKVKSIAYVLMPDSRTTICQFTMENGFTVRGESSCVDPTNFSETVGREMAYEAALQNCWPFEGYLLAEEMYQASLRAKGANAKAE